MTDDKPRNGKGKYRRSEQSILLDNKALEIYSRTGSYSATGREMNMTTSSARERILKALDRKRDPETAEAVRQQMLARAGEIEELAAERFRNPPPVASAGKVLHEVPDHNAANRSADTVMKAVEFRAKLHGLTGKQAVDEETLARKNEVLRNFQILLNVAAATHTAPVIYDGIIMEDDPWAYYRRTPGCHGCEGPDPDKGCAFCRSVPGSSPLDCDCSYCVRMADHYYRQHPEIQQPDVVDAEIVE